MSLQVGDIVTVIDTESLFRREQGKVEAIRDDGDRNGPYCVKFDTSCDWLFGGYPTKDGLVRFQEHQLSKQDQWDPQVWARNTFGRYNWHTVYSKEPWKPENECMHESHGQVSVKSTGQILLNCWGNVYVLDVCDEHKWLHGMLTESLSIRQT